MITSHSNAGIKDYIRLRDKSKERALRGEFVIEGVRLFCDAPPECIKKVYLSRELLGEEAFEKVRDHSKATVIEEVSKDILCKLAETKSPQGVVAIVSMPGIGNEDIFDTENGLYIVADGIQDPGNLGTMIRTGESAGVTAVILTGNTADPFQPKCIRSTMGSIFRLPVIKVSKEEELLSLLNKKKIVSYATSPRESKEYTEQDYRKAVAFWIGNEASGLSEEIINEINNRIYIPMQGRAESLNAAVSAAVLMFEAARQRKNN